MYYFDFKINWQGIDKEHFARFTQVDYFFVKFLEYRRQHQQILVEMTKWQKKKFIPCERLGVKIYF